MQLARTYAIETERCIIRCYRPEDVLQLHEAIRISIDHLRPWLPWISQEPKTLAARTELVRRFRGQFDLGMDYVFAIFEKTGNVLIGSSGLHTRTGKNAREIGYWIHALYTGKGYASETVSALTKIGFDVEGLSRIEIRCDAENIRSSNIPKKLGYRLETIISDNSSGEKRNLMIWSMSKEEYDRTPLRDMPLQAFDFREAPIPFL